MAAFENISRTFIPSEATATTTDFKTVTLPRGHPETENEYDSYAHRDPKVPIKKSMAYFNLLRSMFGAGVLAMPLAISQAGMVLGPMLTILVIVVLNHTHHMLLECLTEISNRIKIPYIPYRYGFRVAVLHGPTIFSPLGHSGPYIVATFMYLSQIGICCVFIIFISDSWRDVFDMTSSLGVLPYLYVAMLFTVYTMNNLKVIAEVSMFANACMLLGILLTFYDIVQDQPYDEYTYFSDNLVQIMLAIGIILFNHSTIAVIIAIDRSLKNPTDFIKPWGILTIGMVSPALVGMCFGIICYWKYGVLDENVLRTLPLDDKMTHIILALYATAVSLSYPLQCLPAVRMMQEMILAVTTNTTLQTYANYTFGPSFVTLTFLIVSMMPFQGPFVAFVGSVCTSQLTLVFPAFMELCLLYPSKYGKYNFYLIKNLLLIVVGLLIFVCGGILCGYLLHLRVRGM